MATQEVIEAREKLALFAATHLKGVDLVKEHSRLCASYVAAVVRDDRASGSGKSLFDLVFGPDR